MGISSLNSAATPFRPNDLGPSQASQASQALSKLNATPEFSIESLSEHKPAAIDLSEKGTEPKEDDLRKAFQDFVGQTLFSQMISSMRSTQDGAAYFDGGRAEKIFQGQLDQILSEKLSEASASKISDPMYKLFQLRRQ